MSEILWTPLTLGALELRNRVVMAPMTRNRADEDGVPTALMAEHYAQRAEAGLIVAEGAWPTAEGQAYNRQPGIATAAHVAGWRKVTDAVHAKGGRIVLQLMHSGRIGSRWIKPQGVRSVSSSAVQAKGQIWTDAQGMQDFDVPHALTTEEVREAVQTHAQAAQRAMDAGFDGVELHGTSGYLCLQFLHSSSNQRTDAYGGGPEQRSRFAVECLQAMSDAIGAQRVGLRLNPGNTFNDTSDTNSAQVHAVLMRQAAQAGIAYLHIMRSVFDPSIDAFALAREHFGHNLILNDGFDAVSAEQALQGQQGAAVSFARHFIANPDLVQRMQQGLPLSKFDRNTLYTAGDKGYNDYPVAGALVAA